MAGIEFLPEERSDEPAEVDVRTPRGRMAWIGRAALAGALVAAVAVWVAIRPAEPKHTAEPAAAPSSSVVPSASASRRRIEHSESWSCSTGAAVQPDVVRAMRRFLPSITLEKSATLRCVRAPGTRNSRILSESVYGSYQEFGIRLELSVPRGPAPPDSYPGDVVVGNHPLVVLGTSEAESAGLRATITATGSSETVAPLRRMQELASYICLQVAL